MSRIPSAVNPSAGGMKVAPQAASGVYTLLTLIGTAFLVAALVLGMMSSSKMFGWVFPYGDAYEKSMKDAQAYQAAVDKNDKEVSDTLNTWDLATGKTGNAPAAAGE